jgi:hypothetical protein
MTKPISSLGYVKQHNFRIWGDNNARAVVEGARDSSSVAVLRGLSKKGLRISLIAEST